MVDSNQRRHTRRTLLAGFFLGIAFVIVSKYVIEHTTLVDHVVAPLALGDTRGSGDAIVVLSAGNTGLCTPNLNGLQRVLLAADLYQRGRAPWMVITGGRPTDGACTLAAAMRDFAVRLGVPADRIRVEETSRSTWENAERSDAVLKALGVRRIVLVTDRHHMSRADACFRRFGYDVERAGVPVLLGHTSNWSLLAMSSREFVAWAYYWWRGRLASTPATGALVSRVEPISPRQEPFVEHVTHRDDAEAGSRNTVVVLGASYAAGWPLQTIGEMRVINKGVAGQQSWELLERFDRDVVALKPRAVIIWGFINDIHGAEHSAVGNALARAQQSMLAMIDRARASGIEPILATEVTIRGRLTLQEDVASFVGRLLGKESYQSYVNRHVLDTNAWLREVARQRGLFLLDLQPAISGPDGFRRRAYAAADGSHISMAGYEALTQSTLPMLRYHLGSATE
jgi:uncharacterized SAM-binding protein YcdF (DUF218 family)/lysophospholipase L1-like esterase